MRGVIQSRRPARPAWKVRSQILAAKKITYLVDARGLYRIFAAAEYRFCRSSSTPPVEGATPFATNATLPHEPSDVYGNGTWYLSVSYFNGIYDSGFLPVGPMGETYIRLDLAAGIETGSPPEAPLRWHLETRASGVVRIMGVYAQAGSLRADDWALAYTTNGSTPPTDTPDATQAMATADLDYLVYDLPAQSNGTTVKVRLQTRRNDGTDAVPVWVYSESSDVLTIAADATGPTAPRAMEGS